MWAIWTAATSPAQGIVHAMLMLAGLLGEVPPAELERWATPGARVLVIGDSHTNGSFGRNLSAELRALPGAEVTVIGSCGRWANAWLRGLRAHCGLRIIDPDGTIRWGKGCSGNPCEPSDGPDCSEHACRTPRIDQLLDSVNPDLVVVAMGGNSYIRGTPSDHWREIEEEVRELAETIGESGRRCLWVTPPHGLNKSRWRMKAFARFVDETVGRWCVVFDSGPHVRPYLDYAAAVAEAGATEMDHDRIHYDRLRRAGRWRVERWAGEVAVEARGVLEAWPEEPWWAHGWLGQLLASRGAFL